VAIGAFSEKDRQPTQRQVSNALGTKRTLWESLSRFISSTYQIPGDLSFGGKNYGWNVWYRKSGKTLVSLYPQNSYFVAQVVLGSAQAEQALALKLGKNVHTVIEDAPQLHDGRRIFIKVRTPKDVKDVEQLLRIKKRPRPSSMQ